MPARLKLLAPLLAVAIACYLALRPAETPAPAAPASQATPPKSYVVHFDIDSHGLIVADATLNLNPQQPEVSPLPRPMAIDTGAPKTCFFASSDMIDNLAKIMPGAKLDSWLRSDGSEVKVCRFDPARLSFPGIAVDMPIYASAYDMRVKPEFDGVIGEDFLSRFDVDIDYDLRTIILTDRQSSR